MVILVRCGPGSSTAISSTAVLSTLVSSNPVLSTILSLLILCINTQIMYNFTCLPNN